MYRQKKNFFLAVHNTPLSSEEAGILLGPQDVLICQRVGNHEASNRICTCRDAFEISCIFIYLFELHRPVASKRLL